MAHFVPTADPAAIASEALRQSEERYRALVEANGGTVWSWSPEGSREFKQAEQWWEDPTGQSTADTARTPAGWLDAVHPEEQAAVAAAWAAATATGAVYDAQYRVRARAGGWCHVHARGVPIPGPGGTVREWVGTLTDVTARCVAEADRARLSREVEAERRQLAEVFDHAPSHMCVLRGPDHVFELANQRHRDLHAGRELVGRPVREAIPELEGQGFFELLDKVDASGEPFAATDMRITLLRGGVLEERVLDFVYQPLRGPDGAVTGVLAQGVDLTDRVRAESGRAHANQALALALSAAELGAWEWHPATDRLTLSDRAAELFGVPAQGAYTGDWMLQRVRPDHRDRVRGMAGRAVAERAEYDVEYRLEGGMWLSARGRGLYTADRTQTRMIGVFQDVTARKESEDRLRQAVKMEAVGHLAGGVAHDFNNLLTVINGYSELLLQGLREKDPAAEPVAEILAAGRRAEALTRQLLAFGRRQVLLPQSLDLNELIANLSKMLVRLLGEDVDLTTHLSPSLERVIADYGQIEQVIVNLCVNARDAMPTGGRLTIGTDMVTRDEPAERRREGAAVRRYSRITVSDTGCGMTDAVREKIFEPFFTTKGVGQGTGLGLATVFGIVQQSGGHIEVTSEVGVGTTFCVSLGLEGRSPPAPEPAPEPARPVPQGRDTVLLVEDERAVRRLTALVLRGAGYTVLEAHGAEEAARVCAGAAVRLLVTDVVMSGASGRELAERLTATTPGLRVLYMSGYTDDRVVRHGVQSSRVAFIQKPFNPAALLHKVREVLDLIAV